MAGGQAIFEWKCMFFQLLSGIKVKVGDQITYKIKVITYVLFCMLCTKNINSHCFNLISNSWWKYKMAAKMASMFDDVTDLQQHHHP